MSKKRKDTAKQETGEKVCRVRCFVDKNEVYWTPMCRDCWNVEARRDANRKAQTI